MVLSPFLPPLPVASVSSMACPAFHPPVSVPGGGGPGKQILPVGQQAVGQSIGCQVLSPWPLPEPPQSLPHCLACYSDLPLAKPVSLCHFLVVLLLDATRSEI